jgi:2-iminobutanoate/2-iminopropanoate deaminase
MNLAKLNATVVLLLLSVAWASGARQVIQPKEFPAGRPFSPGLLVDGTLYVSGQVGQDLKTGQIPGEFEAEMRQCLDNIGLILKEAGMGFEDVFSVQVYLTDIGLFGRMNAVYTTYFKEPRPTRTTVGVAGLAGPAKVEITVTARRVAAVRKGGAKK